MSNLFEGKRVITTKVDVTWEWREKEFVLSWGTADSYAVDKSPETFKAEDWDIEVVLTPKFKPGYYQENRTGSIPGVVWMYDKPESDYWVRVEVAPVD